MFCSFVVLNGAHLNIVGRIRTVLNFPTSRMKVGPTDLRNTGSVLVCPGWHTELLVRLEPAPGSGSRAMVLFQTDAKGESCPPLEA